MITIFHPGNAVRFVAEISTRETRITTYTLGVRTKQRRFRQEGRCWTDDFRILMKPVGLAAMASGDQTKGDR